MINGIVCDMFFFQSNDFENDEEKLMIFVKRSIWKIWVRMREKENIFTNHHPWDFMINVFRKPVSFCHVTKQSHIFQI